jgi:hypothetical protein
MQLGEEEGCSLLAHRSLSGNTDCGLSESNGITRKMGNRYSVIFVASFHSLFVHYVEFSHNEFKVAVFCARIFINAKVITTKADRIRSVDASGSLVYYKLLFHIQIRLG